MQIIGGGGGHGPPCPPIPTGLRKTVGNRVRMETERQREYGRQELKNEDYSNNRVGMSRVKSESCKRREIY